MRRALLAALLCTGLLAGCSGTSGKDANGLPGDGGYVQAPERTDLIAGPDRRPAPVIKGEDLTGQPVDVASLRGKVVVLNFWASWCGPCNAEAPVLNDVFADTKGLGVQFLGVNIKDDKGSAQAFERGKEVAYSSLYDQPAATLLRFRKNVPQTPPSTVLIDRQGRVAGLIVGPVTINSLTPVVQALAAESA